jgi:hypothetical protein
MPEDIKKITMPETMPIKKNKKISPLVLASIGTPLIILVFFSLLIFIGIYRPALAVVAKGRILAQSVQSLAQSAKNQNIDEIKIGLQKTRQDLSEVKIAYAKLTYLRPLPLVGAYISDGVHALDAFSAGLDAGDRAIEALEPNADLLGLKGGSSFVAGTADERIQTAVKTMKALTPKIAQMADSIGILQKEIAAIDPVRYPVKIRGVPVREKIVSYKEMINGAAGLFVNAQPLLAALPGILGEPDERRYLVLFQNDKELRATGGFITAYAQFRLVKGKIILERSDNIYTLDNALTKKWPAPREILTYHKNVNQLHIRDSNLSPDFAESMKQFLTIYQSASGIEKNIDGIIAVDTHVLVETLKILGPTYIKGREFSADIDQRCDCPKAVYELEDYSTRPVNYLRTDEERKDVIGILLRELMQKALGVSPSQYWGRLFQMLFAEINRKHVLTYFTEATEQAAAESFNMAGRILTASVKTALFEYDGKANWDYLHVNNSNMASGKANMFVSTETAFDSTAKDQGFRENRLTINYKNPYPGSDCGLASGGLCLNAPLRNWVRIYVPKGSKLIDSKGSQSPKDNQPVPLETREELDKTVFEGFLVVNPLGTAKLELTYQTPVTIQDNKYRLLIQKQPGTENNALTFSLEGKTRKQFNLDSDIELVY